MAGGSLRKKPPKRSIPKLSISSSSSPPSPCLMASLSPLSHNRRLSTAVLISLLVCVALLLGFSPDTLLRSSNHVQIPPPHIYTIEVVNEYPHDPEAFTQGILYGGNDTLFESTGLHGKSSVRKVDLKTGKVEALERMDYSFFGEGLTIIDERLYQVTWLTQTGFIYERNNLSKFERFTHQMRDGWGLATDGRIMFGSDGSSILYQIDPVTMKAPVSFGMVIVSFCKCGKPTMLYYAVVQNHTVRYKGLEVPLLNELEYIDGEVWANVWQTDCIARISPRDGTVLGWILLPKLRAGLVASGSRGIDVLNGIAWDKDQERIFVTGKLWPKLYEINVHPVTGVFQGNIKKLCVRGPARF